MCRVPLDTVKPQRITKLPQNCNYDVTNNTKQDVYVLI